MVGRQGDGCQEDGFADRVEQYESDRAFTFFF